MTAVHGKNTVIMIDGVDISEHCNTSTYDDTADVHRPAGYGAKKRRAFGGVGEGKFTCGGTFDNSQTNGPDVAFKGKTGETLQVVYRPEGTGTGKPEDQFAAVLIKYSKTAPVDDMVAWTAELEIDGEVTSTTQA